MAIPITPLLQGFGTGAGLIVAIGAQNAFVLKQGLLKNHMFWTALTCAVIDAVLITVGVGGFGTVVTQNELFVAIAKWGGAAFLFYYGLRSFRAVFRDASLSVDHTAELLSLKQTLIAVLVFSLLNPHVYLDTVVLLGSIGAQFPEDERVFFAIGAVVASFVWFFSLSYGTRLLVPLFKNPLAWKVLDFLIGCVMWVIAICLLWKPGV